MLPSRTVDGVQVPAFLYGTAWKEDATEGLVRQALEAGFRGIDTANQRKHYFEAGVGAALADSELDRDSVFVQTKFTFQGGQDHRLPYDANASTAEQVHQSFESSLSHLGVETLDSLVLHGPSQRTGLGVRDREAWSAMQTLAEQGRVRLLGVSNVSPEQLNELLGFATRQPSFVQNRCYARQGWDRATRAICDAHGIVYQGFSLLTANRGVVASPELHAIAVRHSRTPAQVIFRFAIQIGMLPLTGTSDPMHMREDLAVHDFELDHAEVAELERIEG